MADDFDIEAYLEAQVDVSVLLPSPTIIFFISSSSHQALPCRMQKRSKLLRPLLQKMEMAMVIATKGEINSMLI
jgi:hypothetical protein